MHFSLAVLVTPANAKDRAQVTALAEQIQEMSGVIGRSFAWMARFRQMARDYGRLCLHAIRI